MSRLETVTHSLLICVCCVSLVALIEHNFVGHTHGGTATSTKLGQRLPLPSADLGRSKGAVVIVLRSTCQYCVASIPFYRQLAEHMGQGTDRPTLVVVSPEPSDVTKAFLARSGLVVDDIYRAELSTIGAIGTPTVFIANSMGVVKQEYRGKLSAAVEKELLEKATNRTL